MTYRRITKSTSYLVLLGMRSGCITIGLGKSCKRLLSNWAVRRNVPSLVVCVRKVTERFNCDRCLSYLLFVIDPLPTSNA